MQLTYVAYMQMWSPMLRICKRGRKVEVHHLEEIYNFAACELCSNQIVTVSKASKTWLTFSSTAA